MLACPRLAERHIARQNRLNFAIITEVASQQIGVLVVVVPRALGVSGIRKVQRVARALAPESCSAPVRSVF